MTRKTQSFVGSMNNASWQLKTTMERSGKLH